MPKGTLQILIVNRYIKSLSQWFVSLWLIKLSHIAFHRILRLCRQDHWYFHGHFFTFQFFRASGIFKSEPTFVRFFIYLYPKVCAFKLFLVTYWFIWLILFLLQTNSFSSSEKFGTKSQPQYFYKRYSYKKQCKYILHTFLCVYLYLQRH